MKKCVLSAVAGALAMLILLAVTGRSCDNGVQASERYEHIDYVAAITEEDCYLCGDRTDCEAALYWGEDNVGIVDLNTFELLRLEIVRGNDDGAAGYMSTCGMSDKEAGSYVHAFCWPDNAYGKVQLSGVRYCIDRSSVQGRLCQACLDPMNSLRYGDHPPAEYAVISFRDRTVRPLLDVYPWFSVGNYGIDCEFSEDGEIELLIHYIGPGT